MMLLRKPRSEEWDEIAGKDPPRIVLRREATVDPVRLRLVDPAKPSAHHRTTTPGQNAVRCLGGCGKMLKVQDVLVCGDECGRNLRETAAWIVDVLDKPPAKVELRKGVRSVVRRLSASVAVRVDGVGSLLVHQVLATGRGEALTGGAADRVEGVGRSPDPVAYPDTAARVVPLPTRSRNSKERSAYATRDELADWYVQVEARLG